jgi:hypothetical protein
MGLFANFLFRLCSSHLHAYVRYILGITVSLQVAQLNWQYPEMRLQMKRRIRQRAVLTQADPQDFPQLLPPVEHW